MSGGLVIQENDYKLFRSRSARILDMRYIGYRFNVLQETLFQGTQIPLQKWFLAIFLMGNAKKSLSSCQLA